MKAYLPYIKKYWLVTILAPALMLVEVLCDLAQPLLMSKIVDVGIGNGDFLYIVKTGVLMVALALVGIGGGVGCIYFSSISSQSFAADLRHDVFDKIQTLSFGELDKFGTSTLITRLTNDVTMLQNVLMMTLRMLARAPFMLIGGIIMAVIIAPRLALILAISIPILTALLYFVIKKGFPLFATVQRRLDRVNAVIHENLTGVRVVKAYVRHGQEESRFEKANKGLWDITVKAMVMVSVNMPVLMLIMNFTITAVLWRGGHLVGAGDLQVGKLLSFITYITQILFSLMMISMVLMFISRAKASSDRVLEVMNTSASIKDPKNPAAAPPENGSVSFSNVSFRYPGAGGEPVLKNITFSAGAGETVGIIGATGSAKSTMVGLIPRLFDPIDGAVSVGGRDVREYSLDKLRGAVGVVLQENILFSGSVRENITWGKEGATTDEVVAAAKAAAAHDFISALPNGYDTLIEQRGANLSGGQKQRLCIARALIGEPKVLILDGSTSAVDTGTEARIKAALGARANKATTFIIAQRISSVSNADKILVLDEGSIAAEGTHEELMKTSDIYREIYDSQAEGRADEYEQA